MDLITNYWPVGALSLWFLYKWWSSNRVIKMLPSLRSRGAICLDVRTAQEFASGNAPGSINIPLQELNGRLNEIPQNTPIIVGCASGTRSGMAKMLLKKNGIKEVYNIGGWTKFLNQ